MRLPVGSRGWVPWSSVFSSFFLMLSMATFTAECKEEETQKWIPHENHDQYSYADQRIDDELIADSILKIILVGKTGVGKSSTGNTILGKNTFEQKSGVNSVTKSCNKSSGDWRGRELVVIDTPGLFDTKLSHIQTAKELGRCVTISSPGPHAIVLVLQLGRFTEEEKETVERIKYIFGDEAPRYMIVLFTRKDDLEEESIHDVLKHSEDNNLQELLEMCGYRYCAFNNKAQGHEREEQVSELIAMIDRMVVANGGTCFTNELYIQTEAMITKKEEELKKMYMEKLQQEAEKNKQELKEEYERKLEEIRSKKEEAKNMGGNELALVEAQNAYQRTCKTREEEFKRKQDEYDSRKGLEKAEESTFGYIWKIILGLLTSTKLFFRYWLP